MDYIKGTANFKGTGLSQGQYAVAVELIKHYEKFRWLKRDLSYILKDDDLAARINQYMERQMAIVDAALEQVINRDAALGEALKDNLMLSIPYRLLQYKPVGEFKFYQIRKRWIQGVYKLLMMDPEAAGYKMEASSSFPTLTDEIKNLFF